MITKMNATNHFRIGVRKYMDSVAESGSRLGLIRESNGGPTWDRLGDENWDPNWNRFGARIAIRNDIDYEIEVEFQIGSQVTLV